MSTTSPPSAVAALDSAVVWTGACLQQARTCAPTLPTPCRDWDLAALLAHMEDSFDALVCAAELGHVDLAATVGPAGPEGAEARDDPVDRLVQRACRARAAWQQRVTSAPISVGDLPLGRDTVVLVGALEVAVHGWDVAQATGSALALPEDLAVRLYDVALAVVTPGERAPRFGPALPVPAAVPPSVRLLAHLGRSAG